MGDSEQGKSNPAEELKSGIHCTTSLLWIDPRGKIFLTFSVSSFSRTAVVAKQMWVYQKINKNRITEKNTVDVKHCWYT